MSESDIHKTSLLQLKSERSQTTQRKFVCYLCHRNFRQRADLSRHFRIHTGIPDAYCEICGKGFYQKHNKNKHLLTHFATAHQEKVLLRCIQSTRFNVTVIQRNTKVVYKFECKVCNYSCNFPEAAEFHSLSH